MKSKEELNALKEEFETVSRKLSALSDEELAQVSGGGDDELDENGMPVVCPYRNINNPLKDCNWQYYFRRPGLICNNCPYPSSAVPQRG